MDLCILIVDDDDITRDCLVEYFREEQYRVFAAHSAEAAEYILSEQNIDLILLDIRLPGKDGLTLTRELRAGSEVGIILVTGRQDDIERIIGLECGADDYVCKPFNPVSYWRGPKTWLVGCEPPPRPAHPPLPISSALTIGASIWIGGCCSMNTTGPPR